MKADHIRPEFVEFIPKLLQPGILYISERYKTASHLCACGCGEKVVTPFSPVDWQLRIDGDVVSLHPSIGNWNYACRSHYLIRRNKVVWAGSMSKQQIAAVQARDLKDKARYIELVNKQRESHEAAATAGAGESFNWAKRSWRAFKRWLLG